MLPLGGIGMTQQEDMGAPPVVKDYHATFWWLLFTLLVGVCVCEFISTDIFDAVFTGLMALIVWYMVKNKCAQMTQYCLMMFGIMCAIQSIFEIISLVGNVGGRKTSHTSAMPIDNKSTSYTTIVEVHPFFDSSQGFRYNVQSAVKIASPVTMVIACFLCWYSYKAFPTSLFSQEAAGGEEEAALGGRLGGGGFAGRFPAGPMYGTPSPDENQSVGRALARQVPPRLFEGSGHRLGGSA